MLADRLQELDDLHRNNLLNPPGEWGPWINGGAWLTADGAPVDILLRDVKRVRQVVEDCIAGIITIDFQSGHPFGFVNTIYAAETHYCKPLWQDASAVLDRLKALLYSKGEYSPLMREAVVRKFLWEAGFSLSCGRKAAAKMDLNYMLGSVFQSVCSWVQVVFAINGTYLMNEKGTLARVGSLDQKPSEMESTVNAAYHLLAAGQPEPAFEKLDALHSEIEHLAT